MADPKQQSEQPKNIAKTKKEMVKSAYRAFSSRLIPFSDEWVKRGERLKEDVRNRANPSNNSDVNTSANDATTDAAGGGAPPTVAGTAGSSKMASSTMESGEYDGSAYQKFGAWFADALRRGYSRDGQDVPMELLQVLCTPEMIEVIRTGQRVFIGADGKEFIVSFKSPIEEADSKYAVKMDEARKELAKSLSENGKLGHIEGKYLEIIYSAMLGAFVMPDLTAPNNPPVSVWHDWPHTGLPTPPAAFFDFLEIVVKKPEINEPGKFEASLLRDLVQKKSLDSDVGEIRERLYNLSRGVVDESYAKEFLERKVKITQFLNNFMNFSQTVMTGSQDQLYTKYKVPGLGFSKDESELLRIALRDGLKHDIRYATSLTKLEELLKRLEKYESIQIPMGIFNDLGTEIATRANLLRSVPKKDELWLERLQSNWAVIHSVMSKLRNAGLPSELQVELDSALDEAQLLIDSESADSQLKVFGDEKNPGLLKRFESRMRYPLKEIAENLLGRIKKNSNQVRSGDMPVYERILAYNIYENPTKDVPLSKLKKTGIWILKAANWLWKNTISSLLRIPLYYFKLYDISWKWMKRFPQWRSANRSYKELIKLSSLNKDAKEKVVGDLFIWRPFSYLIERKKLHDKLVEQNKDVGDSWRSLKRNGNLTLFGTLAMEATFVFSLMLGTPVYGWFSGKKYLEDWSSLNPSKAITWPGTFFTLDKKKTIFWPPNWEYRFDGSPKELKSPDFRFPQNLVEMSDHGLKVSYGIGASGTMGGKELAENIKWLKETNLEPSPWQPSVMIPSTLTVMEEMLTGSKLNIEVIKNKKIVRRKPRASDDLVLNSEKADEFVRYGRSLGNPSTKEIYAKTEVLVAKEIFISKADRKWRQISGIRNRDQVDFLEANPTLAVQVIKWSNLGADPLYFTKGSATKFVDHCMRMVAAKAGLNSSGKVQFEEGGVAEKLLKTYNVIDMAKVFSVFKQDALNNNWLEQRPTEYANAIKNSEVQQIKSAFALSSLVSATWLHENKDAYELMEKLNNASLRFSLNRKRGDGLVQEMKKMKEKGEAVSTLDPLAVPAGIRAAWAIKEGFFFSYEEQQKLVYASQDAKKQEESKLAALAAEEKTDARIKELTARSDAIKKKIDDNDAILVRIDSKLKKGGGIIFGKEPTKADLDIKLATEAQNKTLWTERKAVDEEITKLRGRPNSGVNAESPEVSPQAKQEFWNANPEAKKTVGNIVAKIEKTAAFKDAKDKGKTGDARQMALDFVFDLATSKDPAKMKTAKECGLSVQNGQLKIVPSKGVLNYTVFNYIMK